MYVEVELPLIQLASRGGQHLPLLIAVKDGAVLLLKHLRADVLADGVLNVMLRRPEVAQVHSLPLGS